MDITNDQWTLVSPIIDSALPPKKVSGRQRFDSRSILNGIIWICRTGAPWKDLPDKYPPYQTCHRRFQEWVEANVWEKILVKLAVDLKKRGKIDLAECFIDGSFAKAHQHSAGAASGTDEAIGKSRGGSSTKIHLAVDSGGLPVYFEISGGQINDIVHAQSLVSAAPKSCSVTADKGYDSDNFRAFIKANGSIANIPRKENSKTGNGHMDWCLYKYRHLVENAFLRIKRYRGIATRYDKLARNYASNVALAFVIMWLPMHF